MKTSNDLTVYENFARVYRMCEELYGRTCTDLDISRAHARYLKVTGQ